VFNCENICLEMVLEDELRRAVFLSYEKGDAPKGDRGTESVPGPGS